MYFKRANLSFQSGLLRVLLVTMIFQIWPILAIRDVVAEHSPTVTAEPTEIPGWILPTPSLQPLPTFPPIQYRIKQIMVRDDAFFVLTEGGELWSWGSNFTGQLGRVTSSIDSIPRRVSELPSIRSVYKTNDRYLALDENGKVWSWGTHTRLFTNNGSTVETRLFRFVPTEVIGLPPIQSLLSCLEEPTARAMDGSIWTWGPASYQNRIPNFFNYAIEPIKVDHQNESRKLTCDAPPTDLTYRNEQAQSKFGGFVNDENLPFDLREIQMFNYINSYGHEMGLVLLADQSLFEVHKQEQRVEFRKIHLQGTWLSSVYRDAWNEQKPRIRTISAWNETILMVDEKGYAWQWHLPQRSMGFVFLANWSNDVPQSPRLIPSLKNMNSFSTLGKYALLKDGSVMKLEWSTGLTPTLTYAPFTQIDQVKQISETEYGVLFLRKDGTVWASGEIVNTPSRRYTWSRTNPEQLAGLTDIVQVGFSQYRMVALKSDGTLWTMEPSEKPVNASPVKNFYATPLERATGIKQVSYLHQDFYALKTDGSLRRMDVPEPGQQRDPSKDRRVPHVPTFDEVDVNRMQVIARNHQGDIYMGGLNETFSNFSSNMEYKDRRLYHTDGEITKVAAIRNQYLFIKDGMVWGMGANLTNEPYNLFAPFRSKISIDTDPKDPINSGVSNESQQFFLTSAGSIWEVDSNFRVKKHTLPNRAQAIQITAGNGYAAALDRQGNIYIWGKGLVKRNQEMSDAEWNPSQMKDLPKSNFIQAAGDRLYLLDHSNQVWVYDLKGVSKIDKMSSIRSFITNGTNAMAISEDGRRLYAWNLQDGSSPKVLDGVDKPTKIAVTETYYYALDSSGRLYKWDMNWKSLITYKNTDSYQLERSIESEVQLYPNLSMSRIREYSDLIREPIGNLRFDSFQAGTDHILLRAKDGSMWAEGNNDYGQCGSQRSIIGLKLICRLGDLGPVSVFSAGSNRSAAVLIDGSVWMWGEGVTMSNVWKGTSEILPPISSPESTNNLTASPQNTKNPIETPTLTPKASATPVVTFTPLITPKLTTAPTVTPVGSMRHQETADRVTSSPTMNPTNLFLSIVGLPGPVPVGWLRFTDGLEIDVSSDWSMNQKISVTLNKRPTAAVQHLIVMRRWNEDLGKWKTVPGQWNPATKQFDALISQSGSYVVMGRKVSFSDLADAENRMPIEAMVVRGLLNGYGNGQFKPELAVSRAEFASIMANAFELEPSLSKRSLVDVNKKHWAYESIQKSIAAGWMKTSNDRFLPNAKLTREQAYVILARALHLQMTDIENAREALYAFEDGDVVSDFAITPMLAIIDAGLFEPDVMSIRPKEMITRAEIAAVLYRMEAWRIAQQ